MRLLIGILSLAGIGVGALYAQPSNGYLFLAPYQGRGTAGPIMPVAAPTKSQLLTTMRTSSATAIVAIEK